MRSLVVRLGFTMMRRAMSSLTKADIERQRLGGMAEGSFALSQQFNKDSRPGDNAWHIGGVGSAGQGDPIQPSQVLLASMQKAVMEPHLILPYSADPTGEPGPKEAASMYLQSMFPDRKKMDPESIILPTSVKATIGLVVRAHSDIDWAIPSVGYSSYSEVFDNVNEVTGLYKYKIDKDRHLRLNLDQIRVMVEENGIRGLILNPSGSNPGGWVMNQDEKTFLDNLQKQYPDLVVLEERIYDFAVDRDKLEIGPLASSILSVESHKQLGASGLRGPGLIVAPSEASYDAISRQHNMGNSHCPTFQQLVMERVWRDWASEGEDYERVEEQREVFRQRRTLVSKILGDIMTHSPEGGLCIQINIPKGQSGKSFSEKAKQEGFWLSGGSAFRYGQSESKLDSFLRLTIGKVGGTDQFAEELARFREFWFQCDV